MPWSGSAGSQTFSRTNGVHTGSTVYQQDAAASIGIRADYHDVHDQDIASGLSACLKQDGGTSMTAALPMGGNDLLNGGKIVGKRFIPTVVNLVDGASVSLDASAGEIFNLSSSTNPTILAPTNAIDGQKIVIRFAAQGSNRTLSLTTGSSGSFIFSTDIPALSATTSGTWDLIGAIFNSSDGTGGRWQVAAYIKGFS